MKISTLIMWLVLALILTTYLFLVALDVVELPDLSCLCRALRDDSYV